MLNAGRYATGERYLYFAIFGALNMHFSLIHLLYTKICHNCFAPISKQNFCERPSEGKWKRNQKCSKISSENLLFKAFFLNYLWHYYRSKLHKLHKLYFQHHLVRTFRLNHESFLIWTQRARIIDCPRRVGKFSFPTFTISIKSNRAKAQKQNSTCSIAEKIK